MREAKQADLPHGSAAPANAGSGVLVVSNHQLVRESVRAALRSAGFAVASLDMPTGIHRVHEARRWIATMRPRVGLLVTDLDDASQLRDAASILSDLDLDWLLLTSAPPGPVWGALIEVGARDVISTSVHLGDLAAALRRLSAGKPALSGRARAAATRAWEEADAEKRNLAQRLEALSPREMEILVEMHEGASTKAIAAVAGVSEGTVRSQVRSVLHKLEVNSRLKAVASYSGLDDWFAG